ncbi:putative 50S ribosomal protein L36 [Aspergillus uvarum CBS 121591]|uniref:Putative 50S ribosomal protein L36 n=1 Tax=Aspergillus uvarum CBS 121591 TaxID=1448315 RepID=A0A319CJH1_9EURO|nr:putative 50S ribosomal protein L36 [Aspergillus uvarum CBS 121591]PYH84499.1 putative 50S ribosomal protein L36 [Aspergillus uvarum CBS 121591]
MSFTTPLRRSTVTATTARLQPSTTFICSQCRHATLLRRPKRPYQFTQLITMSDGSTFTHRTSSPLPIYRSTRDTRNSVMWNPSSSRLASLEKDEAGRLAAFRAKFGRGFDTNAVAAVSEADKKAEAEAAQAAQAEAEEEDDNLLDLISSFGQQEAGPSEKKKKW